MVTEEPHGSIRTKYSLCYSETWDYWGVGFLSLPMEGFSSYARSGLCAPIQLLLDQLCDFVACTPVGDTNGFDRCRSFRYPLLCVIVSSLFSEVG